MLISLAWPPISSASFLLCLPCSPSATRSQSHLHKGHILPSHSIAENLRDFPLLWGQIQIPSGAGLCLPSQPLLRSPPPVQCILQRHRKLVPCTYLLALARAVPWPRAPSLPTLLLV